MGVRYNANKKLTMEIDLDHLPDDDSTSPGSQTWQAFVLKGKSNPIDEHHFCQGQPPATDFGMSWTDLGA